MPNTHISSPQTSTAIDRFMLLASDARDGDLGPLAQWTMPCMCAEPSGYSPTSPLSSCMADD